MSCAGENFALQRDSGGPISGPTSALPRLHVVHVCMGLNVGGMEKLLTEFARHLDSDRYRQHFLSLRGRGTLAAELEQPGHGVSCVEMPPGFRPAAILRLARRLRALRPDVVHTHNTGACLYAVPAARLARVPVVIHTRHGQRFGATRLETAMFRLLSRFLDRVACVSDDARRLSIREGCDPRRICTIHNGIDLARFVDHGPAPRGPAVLVARLSPEKDVATLLEATAILAADCPDFRLNLVGDGVSRPELESLASRLGVQGHVQFCGEVHDVVRRLAQASMFVLSSLTEGVSLTLLEAMASGLPVVATAVGGNPEVVVHEETGLLVAPRSPRTLAEAMRRILNDPNLGRRMGSQGRRRVEAAFDVRRMIACYDLLYHESVSAAGGR